MAVFPRIRCSRRKLTRPSTGTSTPPAASAAGELVVEGTVLGVVGGRSLLAKARSCRRKDLDVFGLGLAVAILVDATHVRMVLVPSVMQLLGKANLSFPHWLERSVPHFDVDAGPAPSAPLVPADSV